MTHAVIEYRAVGGGFVDFFPDYEQAEAYARRRADGQSGPAGTWQRGDDIFSVYSGDRPFKPGGLVCTLAIREVVPGMSLTF